MKISFLPPLSFSSIDTSSSTLLLQYTVQHIHSLRYPHNHIHIVLLCLLLLNTGRLYVDMFFKVKIQGQDPVSKQDVPNLKVITAPIKVISKPEQLKKRQPAPLPIPNMTASTTSTPIAMPITNTIANPPTTNKKRTVNDLVVEAVTRIEKQQYEQNGVLERIMQLVALPKQEGSLNPNTSWEFLPPLSKMPRKGTNLNSLTTTHPSFFLPLQFFILFLLPILAQLIINYRGRLIRIMFRTTAQVLPDY